MSSNPCLMGIATELRIEIYRHVLVGSTDEVHLTCCDHHAEELKRSNTGKQIWIENTFPVHEADMLMLAELLQVNKTIRSEIETFLFNKRHQFLPQA